jgi:hypothetical protein
MKEKLKLKNLGVRYKLRGQVLNPKFLQLIYGEAKASHPRGGRTKVFSYL